MGEHDHKHNPQLDRVLGPTGYELTCEECFDRLDEFVELELQGKDADRRIPGMGNHLEGCPACREEHESVRALVSGEERGTEQNSHDR